MVFWTAPMAFFGSRIGVFLGHPGLSKPIDGWAVRLFPSPGFVFGTGPLQAPSRPKPARTRIRATGKRRPVHPSMGFERPGWPRRHQYETRKMPSERSKNPSVPKKSKSNGFRRFSAEKLKKTIVLWFFALFGILFFLTPPDGLFWSRMWVS